MAAPNVDLVLVIDGSASMRPCFDGLRAHLATLIQPLQGTTARMRIGLLVSSVGKEGDGGLLYNVTTLAGTGLPVFKSLYSRGANDPDPRNEFFTSDSTRVTQVLASVKMIGDEDMLFALDTAADFPFGALRDTKRVIALFSDEKFEHGADRGQHADRIPEIREKLMARHIQLFMAVPDGHAAQELAMTDRCEVEIVQGGDGLRGLDFSRLLSQMGKSISASSLQSTKEPAWSRALFGQDQMVEGDGQFDGE